MRLEYKIIYVILKKIVLVCKNTKEEMLSSINRQISVIHTF